MDNITNDAVANDAVADDAVANDAVTDDAVTDDAVANDAVADDAVANDAVTDDAVANDAVADDTVTDDAVVDNTVEIVGVRFKPVGKIYYFDPNGINVLVEDGVILETVRGVEYGTIAIPNRKVSSKEIVAPLKKLMRQATQDDIKKLEKNHDVELRAREVWMQQVEKHKLEMTLVDVEYTFDNSKLLFYFTAEGRIDFRNFVKDIAAVFKTRIELRQIGVRDEAKQLGGFGVCGREFCCRTFLDEFQQVSIKMAKEQGLSLNSVKISGTCGRLMCCLRYESAVYEEELKRTPSVDSIVTTPDGKGVVVESNVLAGLIKVRLDTARDTAPRLFSRGDVTIIGRIRRNDNNDIIDEELKKLQD